jgi:vacuolar protein sorting-associated protein 52
MWPLFQTGMSEHIESVKKLAEGSGAGFFSKGPTTTDALVITVSMISPCSRFLHI